VIVNGKNLSNDQAYKIIHAAIALLMLVEGSPTTVQVRRAAAILRKTLPGWDDEPPAAELVTLAVPPGDTTWGTVRGGKRELWRPERP
jgi:hypothetical protein